MHAAEALYAAKQFSAAADMYQGLCTPNKDALSLLRTLKSLFFAERRRDARVLFDSLDSGLKVIPRYAEVGVAIYEHAGLLREARAILEAALSQDDTLRRRVHWLSLSERIGDISTMLEWLKTVTVDQVGTPQDLMTVALAIDRLEQDPRCFGIAYRALRASYTDPQVHLAYMIGLFFMGSSSKHPSPQPTVAACDTAILLEEKDGIRKLVRVLETDRDPRLERGEIAPDSELGPALLGKKVGDEIEVPSVGVESTVYVIREIRTKYLHAHFRSLEQFEIMFPGHRAFGSFHIDESKGGEQFKPILDSVKRRGEFTQQLTDMYRKGKLPLMLMSKYSGVSPCDIWEGICSQPDLGLRVCAGLPQDYLKASENLAVKRRAIVDPITLYGITRLGIAERIRACFEDMGVVQTTIDLLRQLVHERSQERGLRHGTMGWDGEHYHMIEVNESVTTNRIEQAQAALMFAESLTLVAAEPSMALIADTRELFEDIDPSFLDSIYAAQGEGRLLLCDDQEFRQLAVELSGIQGIWTQAAALYAGQTGDFTPDDYFDLVGALVGAHYRFTTFDHRVMLHQMRKDVWAITPAITAFTIQLALPSNESSSVIRLLADLARFGWLVKPSRTALVAVFAEIFRSFSRLQPDRDLDVLVGEVLTVVRGLLRSNGYSVFYKNRLLSTTRLTPVEILVSSVRAAADRTFETVAGALAQACSSAKQSEPSRAGST